MKMQKLTRRVIMKSLFMSVLGLALAILAISAVGCAGARAIHPVVDQRFQNTEVISFGNEVSTTIIAGTDPKNAKNIIEMGVDLSKRGKHGTAAKLFHKASNLTVSDGRFRRACLAAAATEHAMAGDRTEFKQTMNTLRAELGEFELLNPEPELEILLLLNTCESDTDLASELERIARQAHTQSVAKP